MIKEKSFFGKLKFINISDQQLFDISLANFDSSRQPCPHCGAIGCFVNASSYCRTMITVIHGKRQEISLTVPRQLCTSCNHSHAILPDCLIPYGSYSIRFVLQVLLAYLTRNASVSLLCSRWQISISTLYNWIHLFSTHYSLWVGVLKQIRWISSSALSLIQETSDFISLFQCRFQFSFLQYRQTPASAPLSKITDSSG